jgi:hypothetical protein
MSFFYLYSCSPHCSSSKFYEAYTNYSKDIAINEQYFLFVDSSIKKKLFNELCGPLSDKKRIIIAEASNQFSYVRKGVLYIYDNNEFYFFEKEKLNDEIKIGKGYKNLDFLKNIIFHVKDNFSIKSDSLRIYSEQVKVHDAPLVVLSLYDIDIPKVQSVNFMYSGLPSR